MIKLNAAEQAELNAVAQESAQRCRESHKRLRFTDPEAQTEFRAQCEQIAEMWDRLVAGVQQPERSGIEKTLREDGPGER